MYNKSFLFLLIVHCSGLLIGMENQTSTSEWSLKKTIEHSDNWVITTAVSPVRNFLATGSGNSKARLFDLKKKKELQSFELQSSVSALAFDPFEKLLAVASRDNLVQIFDINTYKAIACLQHDKLVLPIVFGQSGNTFVTGSFDGKIRIFTKNNTQ